jgi:hypothetical protein
MRDKSINDEEGRSENIFLAILTNIAKQKEETTRGEGLADVYEIVQLKSAKKPLSSLQESRLSFPCRYPGTPAEARERRPK